MPGANDPANQSWPQQPLHKCLFPKSAIYPTFQNVTNPYYCSLSQGIEVLGTSGQNLDDVMLNTELEDPLEALESLLHWGHVAPTCPDTLGCYPFQEKDPFVLTKKPHIFFAANQKVFDQRLVEFDDGSRTLLVAVPSIADSGQLCLINIQTMACEIIDLDCTYS